MWQIKRAAFAYSLLCGAGLWLALPAPCGLAQTPTETRLSIPQSRALAYKLLNEHQPLAARHIALALIERDPEDVDALLVLSRAERLLEDPIAAKKAGKRAWSAAKKPKDKYTAAMLVAQAVSSDGNKLGSQFWLRRAAQVAPDERRKAQAVRDLRYVRSTSPVAVKLDFSIAPSSNINNGPKAKDLGPNVSISGDGLALSGIEYRLGGTLTYRFPKDETRKWRLSLATQLSTQSYSLSSDAKRQAPEASGSDYAFQQLEFRLNGMRPDSARSKSDKRDAAATSLELKLGLNWYGGDRLTNFAGISAGRHIALGERARLSFRSGYEKRWRQDRAFRSSNVFSLSSSWSHVSESGNQFWASGYFLDTRSQSASVANDTYGVQLGYVSGTPVIAGTTLELTAGYRIRNYKRALQISPLLPSLPVRKDREISAAATLVFTEVDYYGFSPSLELSARKNRSNNPLYSTEDIGVTLGLRSKF